MNILLSKISTIDNQKFTKRALLLFMFLYCTRLDTNLFVVSFVLLFGLILSLLFDYEISNRPIFWFGIIVLLSLELLQNYYYSANHHFVLIYLCIIFFLATIYKAQSSAILSTNSKNLLFIIFFFAGFQKLISQEFTDTSYLSYLGINGTLFKPLLLFNDYNIIIDENQKMISDINETNPQLYIGKILKLPFKNYSEFMKLFTWTTIIGEFLLSILFLFRPNKITHIAFILFLITLLPTRIETGFIALLALLGLSMSTEIKPVFKLTYMIIFTFSLIATYTNYGYF